MRVSGGDHDDGGGTAFGEFAATRDDGHEKLPRDGQIAARWRP